MARWKLMTPHYLSVEGTQWEYKETDRMTGKQVRKVYNVPRYLDPRDPSDWTHKADEMIVVAKGDTGDPRDIIITSDPTPDMEPLDKEAREITEQCSTRWSVPAEEGIDYGETLVLKFLDQQAEALQKFAASPSSVGGMEKFAELQERMTKAIEQQTELISKLVSAQAAPAPKSELRRA